MFTGLIEGVGRVLALEPRGGDLRLRIGAGTLPFDDVALGESIAVSGVCLTVVEFDARPDAPSFAADVSNETLALTTLGGLREGQAVNLERAMRPSDRLGGHLVSGHVDGQGSVTGIEKLEGSWRLELAWGDPAWGRYICEKASVAVDGVSLTVAGCAPDGARFWIAVIPHTWAATTLLQRRVGDPVNLEADLLAKYAERLLAARGALPAATAETAGLDAAWLAQHGWL